MQMQMQNTSPQNIENIPNDITEYILKKLNFNNLMHMNEVCKNWNTICPPTQIKKKIFLEDKIEYERNHKYCIYDQYTEKCIDAECDNIRIGYSVVYYPNEPLPEMTPEEIENEYAGPLDYPVYRYENPFGDYLHMFRKLEICHQGPHSKQNLLYCPHCIRKYEIIPNNSTYGTYYMVA